MAWDWLGGRRLLWAGTHLGWFWVGAGALAFVLLLVLYREERRLVSRRTGLGLLGLRMAAAVVLVLALFEPIAARTFRESVRGRVIVAVDVSESMATADPGRSTEEQARLAKVLRLSPGETVGRLARREVARRLLDAKESPVGRIAEDHAVDALAFARDAAPASLPALVEALKGRTQADDPASLTTDWQPALAEALKESDAPILGVILLSDGRRNSPGDPSPTVDRLAARGIPVFPIVIGATVPPRDAAIASVKAPEAVYKGDVATIEATIKLDGHAGREVSVTLDRPGASPLRQMVRGPSDGTRPVVTFRVPMEEVGVVPLTIAVPALEGDARADNDRRTVSVQVADDQARVLLVDGEARWEFRYVRNALARDPRIKVEAVVFHQPEATGVSSHPTYATALPAVPDATTRLPDPLGSFDAIVLGDVDPRDATPEVWARLEAYVAERGGTLVLAPGPRHWGTFATNETARKLLPLLDPQAPAIDPVTTDPAHRALPPGLVLTPTPAGLDGGSWPMLQFASDPEQNRAIWAGLPRLPWLVAGRPKPGATPLATAGDDSRTAIAAHPYGLGKVLWVGSDGTWRWRHRVGDAYHHRFWGQTMRWAASGKLAAGNAYVRFGPLRPRVAEGDPPRFQARISEGVAGVGPDLLIAARVFKAGPNSDGPPGEAIAVVPLRPVAGQPRTFEGTALTLPLGSYIVRLDVPDLAEVLRLNDPSAVPQATLDVIARETSERVELAAARDPLERLATATGGRVFADYEAEALPPLLHARTKEVVRTEETRLWDQPATLLLFFLIVTIEWVTRKRVGLP
jgi:hypothetical protein